MGLLRSLPMLLLLMFLFRLPPLATAQPLASSLSHVRVLDALLQDYAYRALVVRPATGVVYDATVPANLAGLKVSAMRLRTGSLRRRGVQMYKEFEIPVGVIAQPFVERLVLVYQNLGNWSTVYYPLSGYTYLAPVLGILAYDASNLSAKSLPELDLLASAQPILVSFSDVKPVPQGSRAKCVSFDLQGSVNFTSVLPDNTCSTIRQGHFSIVVESIAPSPSPSPSPSPLSPPAERPPLPRGRGKKNNSNVWIIVGCVLGGLVLLVLLGVVVVWVHKFKNKRKMQQMEKAADVGEALHMTSVGSTKAPAAAVTRTQPTLETEYVP